MKRINYWLEHKGIHYLAGFFLLVLIATTALSYLPQEVPQPGTQQTEPMPWLYDLSLGILAAYVFNHLVVVLPAERRQESRFISLSRPLSVIANSGRDLIRDLERIAKCPPRRITEEHLKRVLKALNENDETKAHVAERLSQAESAYFDIIPYAGDLPLDLQECLQRENQDFLREKFQQYRQADYLQTTTVNDLRRVTQRVVAFNESGALRYRRPHYAHLAAAFFHYYTTTETIRDLVDRHTMPTRRKRILRGSQRRGPIQYHFGAGLFMPPEGPYFEYPDTAWDDDHGEFPLGQATPPTQQGLNS